MENPDSINGELLISKVFINAEMSLNEKFPDILPSSIGKAFEDNKDKIIEYANTLYQARNNSPDTAYSKIKRAIHPNM